MKILIFVLSVIIWENWSQSISLTIREAVSKTQDVNLNRTAQSHGQVTTWKTLVCQVPPKEQHTKRCVRCNCDSRKLQSVLRRDHVKMKALY